MADRSHLAEIAYFCYNKQILAFREFSKIHPHRTLYFLPRDYFSPPLLLATHPCLVAAFKLGIPLGSVGGDFCVVHA